MSEHGFVYGSKPWKSQFSVDSYLRTQLTKQPPQSPCPLVFPWLRRAPKWCRRMTATTNLAVHGKVFQDACHQVVNMLHPRGQKWLRQFYLGGVLQGEIMYAPPPPPISGQNAVFRGGGVWGCIFWGGTRREFYTPPFYTPPTPRRVFSGVGGWACIKFGPVNFFVRGVQSTVEEVVWVRFCPWKP